jgi:hypothetical protein
VDRAALEPDRHEERRAQGSVENPIRAQQDRLGDD